MSKLLKHMFCALGALALAYVAWRTGRTLVPLMLALASVMFVVAAVGEARKGRRPPGLGGNP